MSWEVATALLGALALVLDWLRQRREDHRVWARIDDHETRIRGLEAPK